MFLIRLVRFLRGYVRFEAQGVFIERFLNLLARDRISVWDGRKRGDTYTGCTRAGAYGKMRRHAKKAGVRLHVLDKEGMPFHRRRYRGRVGLLIGAGIFVAFLAVMSGFIWRMEVSGNEKLEDSEIIAVLERLGVSPGTWRSTIDVRECERLAMLELHEISWIALNIEGSTVRVAVSESTPPPAMIDPNTPTNIVAGHTGQIVSMRVYEGQPLLREGDTVMAGEVIVSGITQDRLGQNLFRHALADIKARVQPVIRVEVPLAQTEFRETGETRRRSYLQALGFDLPLYWPGSIPGPYRVERWETPLAFFGIPLPLSTLGEEYVLMEEVPVTLTESQAKDKALLELETLERVQLEDAEILEKTMTASLEGQSFVLEASYTCIMEIGVKKIILQSEPED